MHRETSRGENPKGVQRQWRLEQRWKTKHCLVLFSKNLSSLCVSICFILIKCSHQHITLYIMTVQTVTLEGLTDSNQIGNKAMVTHSASGLCLLFTAEACGTTHRFSVLEEIS